LGNKERRGRERDERRGREGGDVRYQSYLYPKVIIAPVVK
jgi:hypothetical protein